MLASVFNGFSSVDLLRQAKDVVKAVKKRLQHKSPRVQLLALTVCSEFWDLVPLPIILRVVSTLLNSLFFCASFWRR